MNLPSIGKKIKKKSDTTMCYLIRPNVWTLSVRKLSPCRRVSCNCDPGHTTLGKHDPHSL